MVVIAVVAIANAGCGGRHGDHGCDRHDRFGSAIVVGMITVASRR